MSEERKKILQMVESGRISAEEGAQLLGLVSGTEPAGAEVEPAPQPASPAGEERVGQVTGTPSHHHLGGAAQRRYWLYPFWGGALLMVLGGAVVSATRSQGRGSRLPGGAWLCGWLPLFLGLLVVALSAWARDAHWIHLSVSDQESHISLSFPLPLRLGAALLRLARRFVPKLRDVSVDETMLALQAGLRDGQPVSIEVEDEEEGEQVHIEIR